MENKKFREELEGYEAAITKVCNKCSVTIENAQQLFIKTKREARKTRDEAINKINRERKGD